MKTVFASASQKATLLVGTLIAGLTLASVANAAPQALLLSPMTAEKGEGNDPKAVVFRPAFEPKDAIAADIAERTTTFTKWNGCQLSTLTAATGAGFRDDLNEWANKTRDCNFPALVYYRGEVVMKHDGMHLRLNGGDESVPLSFVLKQVSRCAVTQSALLVIDAMGTADQTVLQKGLDAAFVTVPQEAGRMGVMLFQQDGVPQRGAIWQDRSLPSYWLDRGLRGEADQSRDRRVSWLELTGFLKQKLNKPGTCLVTAAGMNSANTIVAAIKTPTLNIALEDLAELTAFELHQRKVQVVALPDLDVIGGAVIDPKLPGREFGPLLRYSMDKFKSELAARSWMQYRVIQDDLLREQLNLKQVQPAAAQSPKMIEVGKAIQSRTRKDRVEMLLGSLRMSGVNDVEVQLGGWDEKGNATLDVKQTMQLDVSELSMIGRSAVMGTAVSKFMAAPQMPAPPPVAIVKPLVLNRQAPPVLEEGIDNAADVRKRQAEIFTVATRQVHPMLRTDGAFPFAIELLVLNPKTGDFESVPMLPSDDRRDLYVKLRPGQVYAIRIKSTAKRDAFLRLLVDGLNTLPDYPLTAPETDPRQPGFLISTKDTKGVLTTATIASLNNARAWYCDNGEVSEVRGFFTANPGKDANSVIAREFLVTDAATSEAARQSYTKDIGIVTAAFYAPSSVPTSMSASGERFGTKLGKTIDEKVRVYEGKMYPGELLGVIHVRYGIAMPDQVQAGK